MVHVRTAVLADREGAPVLDLSDGRRGGESDWIVEDVAGWYGGAGVRGEKVDRLQHGSHVARAWRDSRAMTIHGLVSCRDSDVRDREERRLSGVLWDGLFGELKCDDGDAVLASNVRLDAAPQIVKVGTTALRFQVPLIADDPFLYAPEQVTFLHPVGTGIGLEYPLFHRDLGKGPVLTFGTGIAANDPIRNAGNAEAWPVFLVVGDFPGGFEITVNGKTITWPWPTTKARPVEVRMDGSIFEAGSNMTHRASRREWVNIPPGGVIAPEFRGLQGGEGWCEVHHRDTFI